MNKKIDNPDVCEVRSVIRFLNAQNVRAIDIHRQHTAVYSECLMKVGQMFMTKSDLGASPSSLRT
jgi:hypothetical protein